MRHNILSQDLEMNGYCVLRAAFSQTEVAEMRRRSTQNFDRMGQTRNVAHSFHLAGFHRFSCFSALDEKITQNPMITGFLGEFFKEEFGDIGLSDITVNRSQRWHTDLLRGPFAQLLKDVNPWADPKGACIKALVYLQGGKSLRIVRESHLNPTPLDDDALEKLAQSSQVEQLEINAGDVVMMDIRALHRGSTDQEMDQSSLVDCPKILLAKVFGRTSSAFCRTMRDGNAERMAAWDNKYLPPELTPQLGPQ